MELLNVKDNSRFSIIEREDGVYATVFTKSINFKQRMALQNSEMSLHVDFM